MIDRDNARQQGYMALRLGEERRHAEFLSQDALDELESFKPGPETWVEANEAELTDIGGGIYGAPERIAESKALKAKVLRLLKKVRTRDQLYEVSNLVSWFDNRTEAMGLMEPEEDGEGNLVTALYNHVAKAFDMAEARILKPKPVRRRGIPALLKLAEGNGAIAMALMDGDIVVMSRALEFEGRLDEEDKALMRGIAPKILEINGRRTMAWQI